MHGVSQLMRRDGQEFVARLEHQLQLFDPRAQPGVIVREVALGARLASQIQLPPKITMTDIQPRQYARGRYYTIFPAMRCTLRNTGNYGIREPPGSADGDTRRERA